MVLFFLFVLVILLFGFIFAKLDTLSKANKIMRDEILELREKLGAISKE